MAVPFVYDPTRPISDKVAAQLLDGMMSVPAIFPLPGTPEERRVLIASTLTDLTNRVWIVWDGASMRGTLLLTHIVPKIDATAHFTFFDRTLFGRKMLIWNLIGRVFRELDLQRMTVEVPEYLTPLYKFVRKKLNFRLEGEPVAAEHPLVTEKLAPYVPNAPVWVARVGSRRERACWNPETNQWSDVLRLRLLRSEYNELVGGGDAIRGTESPRP